MKDAGQRISGHLQMADRASGRVWVAQYVGADGRTTRRVLGPAWVRDSGRRTDRGAVIWRANDGSKPEGFLTPKEARATLAAVLEAERRAPRVAVVSGRAMTFGDAVDEWLRYVEFDKAIAASTLRGYRGYVRGRIEPEFGRDTPLSRITTARIADYRERLLASGLKRATVRQLMIIVHGILKRAKRKGWVSSNAAADAERVSVRASGDFNVLEPAQVVASDRRRSRGRVALRGSRVWHRGAGQAVAVSRPRRPGCATVLHDGILGTRLIPGVRIGAPTWRL
jgi:hypothetical protein